MYSPILRNRQSELLAIKHLAQSVRLEMMPVLDVAAPTKSMDKEKAVAYVERNIGRTGKCATGFPAVFVDSSELASEFRLTGRVHPLQAMAAAIAQSGGLAIPVAGLYRDAVHNKLAVEIAKESADEALCIRLDATDVSTATATARRIEEFLQSVDVRVTKTHLLLDLQCLYGQDREAISKQVLRLLTHLDTQGWAGILIGGYGLPDQISTAVGSNDQGYLQRIEQDVFEDTQGFRMQSPRWFADYTILPPSVVELDWRLIAKLTCPKALYTLSDSWFIIRGGALSSHPDGYEQYFSIAEDIVALDEYCGPGYSYGDEYIADRSARKGKPGSPASWITACVNHHMTFTAITHANDDNS